MRRLFPQILFGLVVFAVPGLGADNLPEDNISKQLAVQAAMNRARASLSEMNSQRAVEVLEEQLPRVNGNPQYLVLLREAYRAHIRDLYLAGQPDLAKRYLERLCILEPSAANDVSLRPQMDAPPRKFEQPAPKTTLLPFPQFKLPNPFAKREEPKMDPIARALPEETDPFDKKNQREPAKKVTDPTSAKELASRGLSEFNLKRYAEARRCFEEAHRADPSSLSMYCEPWAYCIIDGVSKAMEQPGTLPTHLVSLKRDVEGAIEMAPTKMLAVGKSLISELDKRASAVSAPAALPSTLTSVKHWGQNKEGWQVAETKHFRIFHKQNGEFAERVAQIAEHTRFTMYRKWFNAEAAAWEPICELILHPNVASYTQMTPAPSNSPGHSRVEMDPSKRIVMRRMDLRCDIPTMMEAVLPHEATHIVLAGMFGPFHVPRWADEGIAVHSEPSDKIEQHRRNLFKFHKEGSLFGLKELMEMENYPQPRRVGAFYAQSVVLVEFLTQQKGPRVLAEFVKDGLRQGYDSALQRHYGMTFTQLEQLWQQQVIAPGERTASQK